MQMLLYHTEDRVAYITLNRPEKRNALNRQLVSQLKEAFTRAESDTKVKVIVLKAAGKVFSAGADLDYLQSLQTFSYQENLEDSTFLKDLYLQIYRLPKIVIAQVQGHAIAGGCGLATVCDWVITVPEAQFGYTEVKIGFVPAIVMVFLLNKIGQGRARELLLSGKLITAQQALELGLVNEIVPLEELSHRTKQLAEQLCRTTSAQAVAITKSMIAQLPSMTLEKALHYAAEQNALARTTADCQRGISAFLNKQELHW
ncbi:MAG: enoyl-CoA hydratase/isomerase family protein [Cytophagales bacterium]|nr:enoyl-CoA hydratase/isomerase family protein [Bernardetiaceae bacterium]MDW8210522.1 enoyl-CoA hydratase/isomerase family protein [Cytophagales bacterium]